MSVDTASGGGFYKRGCQEETLHLICRGRYFSDIQSLLAAATLFARAWFWYPLSWEVLGVIFFRVFPAAVPHPFRFLLRKGWETTNLHWGFRTILIR
jgi:hypothetical protein